MGSDLYFYEQCETRKVPRRYRKLPEELPESLRFAHLNPKVAALLASKERGHRLDNEDPFGDGMGKKSLLPDINAAFTNVRNQFDSAMSNDEDSQRYLFEEAKVSAAQVLQQLSRIIYFYEDLFEHIPRSLEYQLMSGYEDFTRDIVVIPREWQTHEMKEQYANRVQQQEAISEEEMSDNDLTGRSRSRMQSERSSEVGSKMNIRRSKPKLGLLDVTEGVEPSDSRLGKRSESRLSVAQSMMKGHLDIGNISRVGSRRKGSSLSSHRSISGQSRRMRDDISLIAETPTEMRSTAMANQLSYMQTINFQLSNKSFEEKGWIMLKGRQEEVDQNTVLEYCITRLQESMKDIANQRQKNLDQGHDKSVAVRYYGDSRKETLLKYRKSPVKTSSSLNVQKGGKPRIPSIVDECNEGKLLMQASHIDGSSVAYYPSGRPAIVHSAAGFGRPGYYTIVYEDELDSKMLACFTPSGRGVCYYVNGVVRFLATEKGGHLTEENGKLIRKWKWPHSNVKITEPICFQINSQLMFRCVSQSQMYIVFSCQKEMSRFSVSPAPEADEYRPIEETDQLLTAFTFSSKAAKDLMRIFAPKKQKKKSRKKKKKKDKDEIETKESESSKQVKFSVVDSKEPTLTSRFRRMSLASRAQERIPVTARSKSLRVISPVFKFVRSLTKMKPESHIDKDKARSERRQSIISDPQTKQSMSARRQSSSSDPHTRQSVAGRRQSISSDPQARQSMSPRRESVSSNPNPRQNMAGRRQSISSDPQARQSLSPRRESVSSDPHARQNMAGRRQSISSDPQARQSMSPRRESVSSDPHARQNMAGRRQSSSSDPQARQSMSPRRESVSSDPHARQNMAGRRQSSSSDPQARQSMSPRRESVSSDPHARQNMAGRRQSVSSDPQTKQNLSTRRHSISIDPQNITAKRQSISSDSRAKQTTLEKRQSIGEEKQILKTKPTRGHSLSPDPRSKKIQQRKQQDDLNKRAKSANQTNENERNDGSIGRISSLKSKEPEKCHSEEKKELVSYFKQDELEPLNQDEDSFTEKSEDNVGDEIETSSTEVAENKSSKMKMPVSILKKRQAKSMNVLPTVTPDHKELRHCKSAKLKSTSYDNEEVEKRAQSATTHSVQPTNSGLSDRQKQGRHQSSTSKISTKISSTEPIQVPDIHSDQTDEEQDAVEEAPTQMLEICPPQIVISDHSTMEITEDQPQVSVPIIKVTSMNDNQPVTEDIPLLTVTSVDDSSVTVDNQENEDKEQEKEEAEEEPDELPSPIPYRRKRGGCIGLPMDTSEDQNEDTKEGMDNVDNEDQDKPVDTEPVTPTKGRRLSSVMQSIMMYRKKVMAKKGIIISSPSSSGTSCSDSDSDDSQTSKSQSTEIIKLLQDFPERVSYDIEAEKELARLQRKAKNLVDDWMEHYRMALGLKSPLLQGVEDAPKRSSGMRNIKSARASNHRFMIRKAIMGLDYEEDEDSLTARKKGRIPSAPLKGEVDDDIDEELQQMIAEKQQTVKFNETGQAAGDGSTSPSLLTTINRLTDTASRRSARSKASSARSGSPSRAQQTTQTERVPSATSGSRSFCPLVIRQQKLNYERPQCRCSRHHIPFIMDIELDDFIVTETQESQLIVIMIVSSLFPGITKAEEMLNDIYVNQNRNRTRPCVQSRMDMFRIFKYDINSAAEMSNHTTPLLMTRHNVVPGMFLIYCDGKLLFCDHIFNGYGNARKDFKKQVMKCRHDSMQGFYLPKDFRFSPSKGKSGLRSAWGGEIGGAGVDKYSSSGTVVDSSLQPIHRPTSTPSSSENSQPLPYDSVKLEQAKYIIASLSATGYQTVNLEVKPTPSQPQPRIQTA